MDDKERFELEQENIVPVMFLHLEEARAYAPDDITAADLPHLIGPISDRVQKDQPWSEAIQDAVREYVGDGPKVPDEKLPEDPSPKGPLYG